MNDEKEKNKVYDEEEEEEDGRNFMLEFFGFIGGALFKSDKEKMLFSYAFFGILIMAVMYMCYRFFGNMAIGI